MGKPLAIFDWSGVISDDFDPVLKAINKVLSLFEKEKVDANYLRDSFSSNPSQFYLDLGIKTTELGQVRRLYQKFFYEGPDPKPVPGAVETVSKVAEISDVVIFSSHPQELLTREVKNYGLDNIRSVGGVNKSYPSEILEKLIAEYDKSRVVYFGDTTVDIDVANATGIGSVAVAQSQSYHSLKTLMKSKPNIAINSIGLALPIVKYLTKT